MKKNKFNTSLIFLIILAYLALTKLGAQASVLTFATNAPKSEVYFQFVPLENHQNTFFIVRVIKHRMDSPTNLFQYRLQIGKSRFTNFFDLLHLSLVPTNSLMEAKDLMLLDEFNRQYYVKDGCNNYFPIPYGEFFYTFILNEKKSSSGIRIIDDLVIQEYFNLGPNQSIFIEVDVRNDSYTHKIIDTPKDIFSDMCK